MKLPSPSRPWAAVLTVSLAFSLGSLFSGPPARAQNEPEAPPAQENEPAKNKASQEGDWLSNYYKDPTPENVPAQLKQWAREGILQDEGPRGALVGFLSQVFKQNHAQIPEWYVQIQGLPTGTDETIHLALWFSKTEEGDAILKTHFAEEFARHEEERDVLTMNLATPRTLDMLWGYFYATGDPRAIHRIVQAFNFEDAPEAPANVPEGDVPLHEVLPVAARWSLATNMVYHPKVKQVAEELIQGGKLTDTEKKWLAKTIEASEEQTDTPPEQ